jgi:hypothetical protein
VVVIGVVVPLVGVVLAVLLPKVFKDDRDTGIPLCSWYSPERRDNFATTDPRWTGRDCAVAKVPEEGYTFVRTEGYAEDYLKQSC